MEIECSPDDESYTLQKKSDKVTVVFFTNTRRYVQRKIIDLHVKLKPESSLLQEVNRLGVSLFCSAIILITIILIIIYNLQIH